LKPVTPATSETNLRLTDLSIQRLPHTQGQKTYWDDTLPGFGVRVGTRAKSFVVMFGRNRRLKTIGRYPDISLRDARTAAHGILASPPKKRLHIVTVFRFNSGRSGHRHARLPINPKLSALVVYLIF
jgi:hypothetical protein